MARGPFGLCVFFVCFCSKYKKIIRIFAEVYAYVVALFHDSGAAHFFVQIFAKFFVITKIFSTFALSNLKQQL